MKSLLLLGISAGLAGCAEQSGESAPTTIVRTEAGATLIAIESDTLVDGRRAKLILLCAPGRPPGLRLDFVRAPAGQPPARAFAQVQVKGGPEVTVELGWAGGANWLARLPRPDQPQADSEYRENANRLWPILYAFSRERPLTVSPPPDQGPGGVLVWSPRAYAEQRETVQACTAAAEPPALPDL